MNRLDVYKLYSLTLLDGFAIGFFIYAQLTQVSWFFSCTFVIYLLLGSVKALVSLHIVKAIEKTGEFMPKLDFASDMLQYVCFALFAFAVCIYCAIQIIHMVV